MRPQRDWVAVNAQKREAERRWIASHHMGKHPPSVRVSNCAGCRAFLLKEVWPCKR